LNPKIFDGLTKMLTGTRQEMTAGPNGASLALDLIDAIVAPIIADERARVLVGIRTEMVVCRDIAPIHWEKWRSLD